MSGASAETRSGGCMCGVVRYRADGKPLWVVHCHCRDCQRAAGAAFATWVGYRSGQVTFAAETRRQRFDSSPGVVRTFCSTCGTPLSFEGEKFPGEIHLMAGTLDEPSSVTPTHHVWTSEAVPWALHEDGLRRRVGGPGSA